MALKPERLWGVGKRPYHRFLLGLLALLTVVSVGFLSSFFVRRADAADIPATGLSVAYANYNTVTLTGNQAQPTFEIFNNTNASVPLSTLTIRYWFTIDTNQPLVFSCFFATVGCNNIIGTFGTFTPATNNADHFLQIAFRAGAGSVAAHSNTNQIQVAFHKADWSAFNQTNDFSWNPGITSLFPPQVNPNVGLFQNGTQVAGTPPVVFVPPAGTPVTGTVNVGTALGQLSTESFGVNAPVFVDYSQNPNAIAEAAAAGITQFRFPGGGTADVYDWRTNSTKTAIVTQQFPNSGPNADAYSQSANKFFASFAAPGSNFDAFMSQVQAASGTGAIVVNYGSSTPQDAADWVHYANKGGPGYNGPVPTYAGASATGHTFGIKNWEIGNEVYGDGTYGNSSPIPPGPGDSANKGFEFNSNTLGPVAYAQAVIAYSQAMKAVDPSISIGAVFTAPGNFPDAQTPDWDATLLNTPGFCTSIDYASVHWYAQQPKSLGQGPESDAALLQAPEVGGTTGGGGIVNMINTLKSRIQTACGASLATHPIQIKFTETNSVSFNPGKQSVGLVNALFLDDDIMTFLENGVTNVDWWALMNSTTGEEFRNATLLDAAGNAAGVFVPANFDPTLFPQSPPNANVTFGDFGLLASGCDIFTLPGQTQACPQLLNGTTLGTQLAAQTPFPSYFGYQMLSHLGKAGDTIVSAAAASNPLVSIHAVKQANGDLAILVVNKDPSTTFGVTVSLSGFTVPTAMAQVFTYGQSNAAQNNGSTTGTITSTTTQVVNGSQVGLSVAPYSTNVIVIPHA